jgi:hypothetical protein
MGIGLRVFLVDEDDSLRRLPLTRYERLLNNAPGECLPEYSGKVVRYVLAAVEFENRRPVEVILVQYSFLHFDREGRLDKAQRDREAKLALEALPPLLEEPSDRNVIDARHRFAKKRHEERYRWKPSAELRAAIGEAIFT